MGVPVTDLFDTPDLYEEKNLNLVCPLNRPNTREREREEVEERERERGTRKISC
jgi:hypothetical protein